MFLYKILQKICNIQSETIQQAFKDNVVRVTQRIMVNQIENGRISVDNYQCRGWPLTNQNQGHGQMLADCPPKC